MRITPDMIYKKRMHQTIHLLFFLALSNAEKLAPSKDSSENAVKRFNLQDLLGQAQVTSPKTQTIDVQELLAAAEKAASNQQQQTETVKPREEDIVSNFAPEIKPKIVDIDVTADKNGNLNLADIPGLSQDSSAHNNPLSMNDLTSLFNKQKETSQLTPSNADEENSVVRQEINLGKQKLELETSGKKPPRYTLAKGPDGGLNLIPLANENSPGGGYEFMQPKGYEEKGRSRQQMQLTTLSQALYSPFPAESNILHLHLRGKDGKDGKSGNKGPMGPYGPKGPEGPKGAKGDAGTCSAQINGLFECTPDELDSLSNRVDYLEKICKKVENAAKKHSLIHSTHLTNKSSSSSSGKSDTSFSKSDIISKVEIKKEEPKKEEPKKEETKEEETKKEEIKKEETKKEVGSTNEHTEKESASIKEKESSSPTKEIVYIFKDRDSSKEKEDTKEKEDKEEASARLKEKETLKLEKEVEESGFTRAKKDENENKEKEEDKPKEAEKSEVGGKKEKVETKEKEKEKETVKEKEDVKETTQEKDVDKSSVADKKEDTEPSEPVKKLNKDGSPPTERSMIDIRAKLKIAELDLMDRIKGVGTKSY